MSSLWGLNGGKVWFNVAADEWQELPIGIGAEATVRLAAQTCGGTPVEFIPRSDLGVLDRMLADDPEFARECAKESRVLAAEEEALGLRSELDEARGEVEVLREAALKAYNILRVFCPVSQRECADCEDPKCPISTHPLEAP